MLTQMLWLVLVIMVCSFTCIPISSQASLHFFCSFSFVPFYFASGIIVQPFSRLPVLFHLFLLLDNLFYGGALAHLRSVSCRLDSVRCGGVLD